MPDLLPDDFGTEIPQPPLVILREQAEHLGRRTGGLVLASVRTLKSANQDFVQQFTLEVPTLDDYNFTLFTAHHSIFLYPVDIRVQLHGIRDYQGLESPSQFEEALRELFANAEVRKIVAALKAQATVTASANAGP